MLWLDIETFSTTSIKDGTYRYAENAGVMVITYAFDDGPVQCYDATSGEPFPEDLAYVLEDPDELITAHNAMFDRNVLRLGNLKIDIPIKRWRCNMVQAMAHALPGGLGPLCDVFKIGADEAKHKEGRALIMLFCKPRPVNSALRRATSKTHPEEWARFLEYAKSDIGAMRAVNKKLPKWNYQGQELALWHLDQAINDRGMCVDTEFAQAAIDAVAVAQKTLKDRTIEMTDGLVQSTTKRDQLLMYLLESYGVDLPNLQKDTLQRRLEDPELPEGLKELLRIRLQASTSSTSKYKSLIKATTSDGRLKGTLQFDGAGRTRRASGRTFQPQNLPRPVFANSDIEFGIEAVRAGVADLFYDNVMSLTSSAIRGAIIAPKGKKLVVADLANIEGRMAAWLAGEDWKLRAFREYDHIIGVDKKGKPIREGHDLYSLAYAKSFNVSPSVVMDNKDNGDGSMRQIGKVQELMLQYEGGVGAFLTGAATYHIDLDELAVAAKPNVPQATWDDAASYLKWVQKQKRSTFGLPDDVFIVCDSLKRLWRDAQPAISTFWSDIQDAVVRTTLHPGTTVKCRTLKMHREGAWLRIQLPSGRCLCYPAPLVDDKGKLSYMGIDQCTHKWSRIKTFGGKLLENITSSSSRDVLYDAMPRIEEAGYQIVLSVHDEVVCETPDSDEFNVEHLCSLLAQGEKWTKGLPLAAAGFSGMRYRKD